MPGKGFQFGLHPLPQSLAARGGCLVQPFFKGVDRLAELGAEGIILAIG